MQTYYARRITHSVAHSVAHSVTTLYCTLLDLPLQKTVLASHIHTCTVCITHRQLALTLLYGISPRYYVAVLEYDLIFIGTKVWLHNHIWVWVMHGKGKGKGKRKAD